MHQLNHLRSGLSSWVAIKRGSTVECTCVLFLYASGIFFSLCVQLLRVSMCVQVDLHVSLQFVIDQVLPFLGSSQSIIHREGAIETIACIL